MLLFEVEKQTLRKLRASDPVVADSQGYLKAGFVFTSDWDGLLKVAQFSREDPEKRHYDILLDEFGICTVHGRCWSAKGVLPLMFTATTHQVRITRS